MANLRRAGDGDDDGDPASAIGIGDRIEEAERYLLCGLFEQSVSLASYAIHSLKDASLDKQVDDDLFAEMMVDAGIILVQALKELGRTNDIFVELKNVYGSVAAIPHEVFLTGISLQIDAGVGSGIRKVFDEYIGTWRRADGGVYVQTKTELADDKSWWHDRPVAIPYEEYLKMVGLYTVVLGMVFHDFDLVISWAEEAELDESDREVLLRKLHELRAQQRSLGLQGANQTSQSNLPGSTSGGSTHVMENPSVSEKADYVPKGIKSKEALLKLIRPTSQHTTEQLGHGFWLFRTVRIKIGKLSIVVQSGKLLIYLSLFLSTMYVIQKKGASLKRVASQQASALRQALFDAWRLAFSIQTNPLAAVQQLPSAPRGSW